MSDNQAKLVQMRLQGQTLDRIENLKSLMHTENRAQIVASSVQIMDHLVSEKLAGNKIILEKPDGSEYSIRFVGMDI